MKAAIPWRAILLESSVVVFGVVLALAANSWRESVKERHRGDTALASIVEELQLNRDAVHGALTYHLGVQGRLREFRSSHGVDEVPAVGAVFPSGFIKPASILSHAWEAATGTGAMEFIPYHQVLLASRLYHDQEKYQGQGVRIGQEIYERIFDGGIMAVARNWSNLDAVISTLVYNECDLLENYNDDLPQLTGDPADEGAIPEACAVFRQRR